MAVILLEFKLREKYKIDDWDTIALLGNIAVSSLLAKFIEIDEL